MFPKEDGHPGAFRPHFDGLGQKGGFLVIYLINPGRNERKTVEMTVYVWGKMVYTYQE